MEAADDDIEKCEWKLLCNLQIEQKLLLGMRSNQFQTIQTNKIEKSPYFNKREIFGMI
jgi:hypothetical protein